MESDFDKGASNSAYHSAERKKSNLAFAFFCMETARAKDMEILYAFCRLMDDIADGEEISEISERVKALKWWKEEIARTYDFENISTSKLCALGREMRTLIERRKIPQEYLQAIIDGVMRDTSDAPFEDFEDIRKYCYGVAAAVGLASIYVFGFKNQRSKDFAEALGYALQFTNILRDVVDDYRSHKRVYIPQKDLDAFGVQREFLGEPDKHPECHALFTMMHFRAKHFFNKARRLLPEEDKRAFAPALIMRNIYEKILDSLEALNFSIPPKPLKISKPKKIYLALKAVSESKKKPCKNAEKSGKVAVVGGGIAGMSAALNLAKNGFDVSLYEAAAHLGGRASAFTWKTCSARLDNGSHALMGCCDNFFKITEILGTRTKEYFKRVDGMDFIFEGAPQKNKSITYPRENSLKSFFSIFSYLKLKDLSSFANCFLFLKLALGFSGCKKGECARDYLLRNKIGQNAIKAFWEPFCVSAINTPLETCDASLMIGTLLKSIAGGGEKAILILPQKPISDSIAPRTKIFLESVGSKVYLSELVQKLDLQDGKILGLSTTKCDYAACDYLVSALTPGALSLLLENDSGRNARFKEKISKIAKNDIINVYFTSPQKLLKGQYACIVGSFMHWVFDHSHRIPKGNEEKYLYGITVSAAEASTSPDELRQKIQSALDKIFGKVQIDDFLAATFRGATSAGDVLSESNRPKAGESPCENLFLAGDWIQTGLPCTMESAAKSALELELK